MTERVEGTDTDYDMTPPESFGMPDRGQRYVDENAPPGPVARESSVVAVPPEQVQPSPPPNAGNTVDGGSYHAPDNEGRESSRSSSPPRPVLPVRVEIEVEGDDKPPEPRRQVVPRRAETVQVVWSDPKLPKDHDEPGPGEQQVEAYSGGVDRVANHVVSQVAEVHERMLNSPAGNQANRILGKGQGDLMTLVAVDVKTEVDRQRKEMESKAREARDANKDPDQLRYEQALENPRLVTGFIKNFQPSDGGPLDMMRRHGNPQERGEKLNPDDVDTFFKKIRPTKEEAALRHFADAKVRQEELDAIPKYRPLKRAIRAHLVQPGSGSSPVADRQYKTDLEDTEAMRGWYDKKRIIEGEGPALRYVKTYLIDAKWQKYEDGQMKWANHKDFDPMPPDAQVSRLETYIAFAWPRIAKAEGNTAADKMLFEVSQEIFDIKQRYRERVFLHDAVHKGEVVTGDRMPVTQEELRDLAELTAVRLQVRISNGEPATAPTAVAEEINGMYDLLKQRKAGRDFFDKYDKLMSGEAPALTVEEFTHAIELAGLTYSYLTRVTPAGAAQHLAETSQSIREGLRGEKRFRELQENPLAILENSGLPFGEANDLLNVADVTRVREQLLDHAMRTKPAGAEEISDDHQDTLNALNRHLAALENDHDGRYRRGIERRRSDLGRKQEAEMLNQGWSLWINGPTIKGDGSAGAVVAFVIGAKQPEGGIDVMGNSWLDQHNAEFLGDVDVQRIEFVTDNRRYQLIIGEGKMPRSVMPNILDRLEPGGMAALQVRPGINEEFAAHAVRSMDPQGYEKSFPDSVKRQAEEAKRKDPSRSRFWPTGTIGYGAEGFDWAMVPSGVCRWERGPDGRPVIVYGHKDGINRGDEWTLLVFRKENMEGRPSVYYHAMQRLFALVNEEA